MKKILVLTVLILALSASIAGAQTTLDDGNSSATFTDADSSLWTWTVDGVDHMFQQQWFYRIGDQGAVNPLSTIANPTPIVTNSNLDPGMDAVNYIYQGNIADVETKYSLSGGAGSSGISDIGEQLKWINKSGDTQVLHLFQYVDWDLGSNIIDDGLSMSITPGQGGIASQWDSTAIGRETVTPGVSHYQTAAYADILNLMNSPTFTNLSDDTSLTGTHDYTFAWQWTARVANGSSFSISKDKLLSPAVPEASTLVGFGSAIVMAGPGMLGWLRRRRS